MPTGSDLFRFAPCPACCGCELVDWWSCTCVVVKEAMDPWTVVSGTWQPWWVHCTFYTDMPEESTTWRWSEVNQEWTVASGSCSWCDQSATRPDYDGEYHLQEVTVPCLWHSAGIFTADGGMMAFNQALRKHSFQVFFDLQFKDIASAESMIGNKFRLYFGLDNDTLDGGHYVECEVTDAEDVYGNLQVTIDYQLYDSSDTAIGVGGTYLHVAGSASEFPTRGNHPIILCAWRESTDPDNVTVRFTPLALDYTPESLWLPRDYWEEAAYGALTLGTIALTDLPGSKIGIGATTANGVSIGIRRLKADKVSDNCEECDVSCAYCLGDRVPTGLIIEMAGAVALDPVQCHYCDCYNRAWPFWWNMDSPTLDFEYRRPSCTWELAQGYGMLCLATGWHWYTQITLQADNLYLVSWIGYEESIAAYWRAALTDNQLTNLDVTLDGMDRGTCDLINLDVTLFWVIGDEIMCCENYNTTHHLVQTAEDVWWVETAETCDSTEIQAELFLDEGDWKLRTTMGGHVWEKNYGATRPNMCELENEDLPHVSSSGLCETTYSHCQLTAADANPCLNYNTTYHLTLTATDTWSADTAETCDSTEIQAELFLDEGDWKLRTTLGEHVWEKNYGPTRPDMCWLDDESLTHVSSGTVCDSTSATCLLSAGDNPDVEYKVDCEAWEDVQLDYIADLVTHPTTGCDFTGSTLTVSAADVREWLPLCLCGSTCEHELSDWLEVTIANLANSTVVVGYCPCTLCETLNDAFILGPVSSHIAHIGAIYGVSSDGDGTYCDYVYSDQETGITISIRVATISGGATTITGTITLGSIYRTITFQRSSVTCDDLDETFTGPDEIDASRCYALAPEYGEVCIIGESTTIRIRETTNPLP